MRDCGGRLGCSSKTAASCAAVYVCVSFIGVSSLYVRACRASHVVDSSYWANCVCHLCGQVPSVASALLRYSRCKVSRHATYACTRVRTDLLQSPIIHDTDIVSLLWSRHSACKSVHISCILSADSPSRCTQILHNIERWAVGALPSRMRAIGIGRCVAR
jgi:hypothetical protein